MGKQIVSAAPGGGGISFEDYLGKLFVVEPLEVEKGVKTDYGEKDAIRANVYVLLGKDKADEYEDTLVFPLVLQSQLRRQIGSVVVGRLEQGEAKKGQKPPWKFAEATPGDLKKAGDFWSKKSIGSVADEDEDEYEDDEDAF